MGDVVNSPNTCVGHYMPTLAQAIVLGDRGAANKINFKGVAVGNPLTYMPYRNYGR